MKRLRFAAPLLATFLLSAAPAQAEGALAVGITNDYSQGVSFGWATNYPNADAADAEALNRCRTEQTAPVKIRQLCRLEASFRDRCVSIALDPKDGETGTGWAVANTRSEADERALSDCRRTAGPGRAQECRVLTGGCDGNAR